MIVKSLSEEKTADHLRQSAEHWEQHGFGLWIFRRGKDVIGLAYAVMPGYWNQGFATEIAQAALEVGFGRLGFSEIDSWTMPINLASQRVMEKLGFRYERDFEFAGFPHRFYRLTAAEREAKQLR